MAKHGRSLIVEEDLGRVPKALAAYIDSSNKNFKRVNHRRERSETDGAEVMTEVNDYQASVAEIRKGFAYILGCMVRAETIQNAEALAMRMGFEFVRTLTEADLFRMAQKDPDVVPKDQLNSFKQADLVIESTLDGETQYVAAEISFTGTAGDAERAIRNANFLTQLTGCPATPAVASVKKNPALDCRIESGSLHWHHIMNWDRELE